MHEGETSQQLVGVTRSINRHANIVLLHVSQRLCECRALLESVWKRKQGSVDSSKGLLVFHSIAIRDARCVH